mgnify:CR=1 FL=1
MSDLPCPGATHEAYSTIADDGVCFERRSQSGHEVVSRGDVFASVFTDWKPGRESFVFFAPHDDDAAISLALTIRQARRESIPVRVVVVTDGRNGYVTLRDRATIVERRAEETLASYAILGVSERDITFLHFPDGGLHGYFGRRVAAAGDPTDEHGYTGLENFFVRELRRRVDTAGASVAPTRVFVPSWADWHQDHVAVAREIPISLFHAIGGIWPECGASIERAPYLYWHCVYCRLPDEREPTIRIVGGQKAFEDKIRAVEAYNSQGQIAAIMNELRASPPVEYLLEESFSLYRPGVYDHCFRG